MSQPRGSPRTCDDPTLKGAARMTGARTNTLATLRGSIERIEAHGEAYTPGRIALGHADADATLQVGLAVGAMHEVFADSGRQSASATGFIVGLAGRTAARLPHVLVL